MRPSDKLNRMPARYLAQLVDYLESTGVERSALMRAARIRAVDDPKAQLTLQQAGALVRAATRASGRTDLGFEMGRRIKTTSHDVLGFALLTSPTLGHVLRLLASYQRLIQPAYTLRLHRSGGTVDLIYRPVLPLSPELERMFQEAIAVSNHFEIQAMLHRRMQPYDIRLSIPRPAHAARYAELAPARVHFGEAVPGLRISLDASLLDAPLEMADARAMQAAEERCKALLAGTSVRRRWSEWCRMMLREAEDHRPTLEQLAGFVNLSARTLHRYLEAEGIGFRDLAVEVRTERARSMLADSGLSVTQIAYRLGYGDVASFVRSFGKRTGLSPTAYRAGPRTRHVGSAGNRSIR